jgi:hypothetical protein
MADVSARATDHGTVTLAITDGDRRRARVELPIKFVEGLKAQIESALVTARLRHTKATRR